MEPIRIVYEDDAMLVCVKPRGVLSQAGGPGSDNMVSLLSAQTGGEVFPVHRLDREVGGVMVYAKTRDSAGLLSRMLQQNRLQKEYLAALSGIPSEPEGMLEDLLFHDRSRNKTYVVDRKRKGVREARLKYRCLSTLGENALVQVQLLTGRTHQIRAQFAARGLPLAGDVRYGGGKGQPQLWSMALTLRFPGKDALRFSVLPEQLGPFTAFPIPEEPIP